MLGQTVSVRVITPLLALAVLCVPAFAKSHRPHLSRPARGTQFVVGPTIVPHGSEITQCTYMRMPGQRDVAVNKVDIKVQGGSHHIHLYRANDPGMLVDDHSETCNFALDFERWGLVLASQTTRLRWKLPPGVAFHFRAGEQLAAQTHYVDTGLLATDGEGWAIMNLSTIPMRKVTAWTGAFFGQDRDVVVPPHSTTTATTRCVFPQPIKVLGLTGHYHFRGTEFTAASWDGSTTGAQIYRNQGYQEPAFLRFDEDKIPELPGIEWTCTYENPTDTTFKFGPFTEENEHCNVFMFYYPSQTTHEFMSCVQQDHIVDVKVHGN